MEIEVANCTEAGLYLNEEKASVLMNGIHSLHLMDCANASQYSNHSLDYCASYEDKQVFDQTFLHATNA